MLPRTNGHEPRVAFPGSPGAFGEAAVIKAWEGTAVPIPARSFASVLSLLAESRVDYGVLPLWNTSIGALRAAYDALDVFEERVETVGEINVPVSLCVLALPGVSFDEVRVLGSHPTALAQCTEFFAGHPRLVRCNASDTAGAARDLALLGDSPPPLGDADPIVAPWYASAVFDGSRELGVVAGHAAAARYRLTVLVEDIQNEMRNVTRFSILQARRSTNQSRRVAN